MIGVQDDMGTIAKGFFEDFFTTRQGTIGRSHILSGMKRCITKDANLELTVSFTEEKVYEGIEGYRSNKGTRNGRFFDHLFSNCRKGCKSFLFECLYS